MMKKLIFLLLGSSLLLACPITKPTTKLKIILLVDSVSSNMADELNNLLKPYKSSSPNYSFLSFSLYQSGMDDNERPAQADFDYMETNTERRKAEFNQFMDPVDRLTKNEYKDCNLLHLINRICNQINDTSVVYHIYIDSKMIENSTVYSPANNDNQVNGHYQFVNGDGEVNSSEIIQANKHLSDSTSWIYRHLVALKKENPIIGKCKADIKIYTQPQTANGTQKHTVTSGKDDVDIKRFWKDLFDAVGISYERYFDGNINFQNIRKMIDSGKTEEIK